MLQKFSLRTWARTILQISCGHNLFVSQEHFFWYSFVQKEASLYIWSIDAINANQGEIRGGNWVSHKHPPDPS